jgi:flavodoxin
MENLKTAIVYYSRTGNTKNAAGILKKELKKKNMR